MKYADHVKVNPEQYVLDMLRAEKLHRTLERIKKHLPQETPTYAGERQYMQGIERELAVITTTGEDCSEKFAKIAALCISAIGQWNS